MRGFILLIVAILLSIVLLPIAFICELCSRRDWGKYFYKVAYSIDQTANAVGGVFFTALFTTGHGQRFGNPDETISGVLGKNKRINKLNDFGLWLSNFLNWLDDNHVEEAIEEDEGFTNKNIND